MRDLSKRQKKAIKTWFNENWDNPGGVTGIEDMPDELYTKIERLNPHETFWQNAERYITDKIIEKSIGKRQYF